MLKDASKDRILAKDVVFCKTLGSKMAGLMFRKKIKDEAWVFEFRKPVRHSIHMFFVFFPIDILFLDDKKRVVEVVRRLKPFDLHTPKGRYSTFIELEAGSAEKAEVEVGDILRY